MVYCSTEAYYFNNASERKNHPRVKQWLYFMDEIYYAEKESEIAEPYRIEIDIQETNTGAYVYTYKAHRQINQKQKKLSLMGISPVNTGTESDESASASNKNITEINNNEITQSGKTSFSIEQLEREYEEAVLKHPPKMVCCSTQTGI